MEYEHTQRGRFQWVLVAVAALELTIAFAIHNPPVTAMLIGMGIVFLLLAASFATLTVRDEGEQLVVSFGPLPLIFKRVPFDAMRAVRAGRSRLIDGWGIHWSPSRGWIWNLWGFDCVELELEGGRLRIGSDDAEGLVQYLAKRIPPRSGER